MKSSHQFWLSLVTLCILSLKLASCTSNTLVNISIPTTNCTEDFRTKFYKEMCGVRWDHYVYPLYMGSKPYLTTTAQAHANSLLNDFQEHYFPDYEYGQAVYSKPVNDSDGQVKEIQLNLRDTIHYYQEPYYNFYDGEPPENYHTEQWSNFAQAVWKETRWMGVGCAAGYDHKTKRAIVFVVIHYEPKGLVPGRFKYNVLPYLSPVATFHFPMQSCPMDLQDKMLRRYDSEQMYRDDSPPFVVNYDMAKIAQREANRIQSGQLVYNKHETNMSYTSDYGTLVTIIDGQGLGSHGFWARYPIDKWGTGRPKYIKNGSVVEYSRKMWNQRMEIGLGCATKQIDDKSILYMVAKFTIPEMCDNY